MEEYLHPVELLEIVVVFALRNDGYAFGGVRALYVYGALRAAVVDYGGSGLLVLSGIAAFRVADYHTVEYYIVLDRLAGGIVVLERLEAHHLSEALFRVSLDEVHENGDTVAPAVSEAEGHRGRTRPDRLRICHGLETEGAAVAAVRVRVDDCCVYPFA